MNETIASVLHDHADGPVDIERMLTVVHTGARRRRRVTAACWSVVMLTLAGAVGLATLQSTATVSGPAPQTSGPVPPPVQDGTTVLDAPDALGSDPTLLHLTLTPPAGWRTLSWSARRDGHEELTVVLGSGGELHVEAARDEGKLRPIGTAVSPVTVHGRPATAAGARGVHQVRWQPVAGIWVQVEGPDAIAASLAVAEQVRLDRVHRCAVPFRLTAPAAAALIKCETVYRADPVPGRWTADGGVWLALDGSGTEYQVAVGPSDASVTVNDTIAGRPVQVVGPAEIRFPYDGRTAWFWTHGTADGDVLRSLVAAFTPVTDPDPAAWPSDPLR